MNAGGKVVGDRFYGTGTGPCGFSGAYYDTAYCWQNGTRTDLFGVCVTPPGLIWSFGYAINDSGVVVGKSVHYYCEAPARWISGNLTLLDMLAFGCGQQANSINNLNQIVGQSANTSSKQHAVLWNNTTAVTDLQTLAGTVANKESYAFAINNNQRIAGKSMITANSTTFHAFMMRADEIMNNSHDLGNLVAVEALNSEATAINDLDEAVGGTVVANGQYHAFWRAPGTGKDQGFVDLGVLSGDNQSVAQGINFFGHIVGWSKSASGTQRAFVHYNNGQLRDLITLVNNGTGWVLKSAEGINDSGWIVGWGTQGGTTRAFLLTPNF